MRKTITYPLLGLIVFFLCWINLPPLLSDRFREWISAPFGKRAFQPQGDELARLQLENRSLRSQIDSAYEWLLFSKSHLSDRDFLEKRKNHIQELFAEQGLYMPAQVTYRDPSLWSSSLWVNVGEKTNRSLGKKIIAKNSPVLAEGALVGVVEFVGEKQSRVRLITDSGLCPSVRVTRGGLQNRELSHQLDSFFKRIEKRDDLFSNSQERETFLNALLALKKRLGIDWEDGYLAKGELRGSSSPFWRSRSPHLQGVGFNFDYPDFLSPHQTVPILKEGDLLVTTGLDGVFPPNLSVGTVTRVHTPQMSSTSYEIEARPAVSNLNDLHTLFIIPPVSD